MEIVGLLTCTILLVGTVLIKGEEVSSIQTDNTLNGQVNLLEDDLMPQNDYEEIGDLIGSIFAANVKVASDTKIQDEKPKPELKKSPDVINVANDHKNPKVNRSKVQMQ